MEKNIKYKPKKFTPQELADKLDKVVDDVRCWAEDTADEHYLWAKTAKERFDEISTCDDVHYGKKGIILSLEETKELCPELYNQVIVTAISNANEAGNLYIATND